jgi:hypothetical protein
MSTIRFTRNYDDLSTDRGYQFKFYCDRCGNGYLSSFQTSVTGMATGLLSAAGSMLGGVFGRASSGAYEFQRAVGGKAHDDALRTAVEEIRPQFHQCSRCGKWVCPDVCWNTKRGLCVDCAPNIEQEVAAAQAQATKDQIWQKTAEIDYTKKLDLTEEGVACCPKCGAKTGGGKFCPECGAKIAAKTKCSSCGFEFAPGTKFCPECGAKANG